MDFTKSSLQSNGFEGFVTFDDLPFAIVPPSTGVYAVVRPHAAPIQLCEASTGFWYRGTDPSYPIEDLRSRWIEDAEVLYIGKAGKVDQGTSLSTRLSLYRRYGNGENTTHRGGRSIWQIADASALLLTCWKVTPGEDAEDVESELLIDFKALYGKLPFANRRAGRRRRIALPSESHSSKNLGQPRPT